MPILASKTCAHCLSVSSCCHIKNSSICLCWAREMLDTRLETLFLCRGWSLPRPLERNYPNFMTHIAAATLRKTCPLLSSLGGGRLNVIKGNHKTYTSSNARHQLFFNPSNAQATFVQKHKDAKFFEKPSKPYQFMLVFIIKFSLSSLRWVPICHGFSDFSALFASFCIGKISHQQDKG